MPNWVYTTVEIVGNVKDVKEIKEKLKSEKHNFDLNNITPMPDHIFKGNLGQKERELYGSDNWYDWSVKNWGTKWNVSSETEPLLSLPDNSLRFIKEGMDISLLQYYFQTAWGAVFPVIEKLSEMYPDVVIKFSALDEGHGFGFVSIYKNCEEVFGNDCTDSTRKLNALEKKIMEGFASKEKIFKELRKYL